MAGLVTGLVACGDDSSDHATRSGVVIEDPGPVHVHGLGINPRDGALFIATHTGLFRAAAGEQTTTRVAGRYQDTMGFTVLGPDRFLGSGHPDLREKLPVYLGLILSTNAGQDWTPVSLLGKADFHVLEAIGDRVVGFGSDFRTRSPLMLLSDDGGRTWSDRRHPEPLIDLAIDPANPNRMIAASDEALYRTTDAARTWERLEDHTGLLGWNDRGELFRVNEDGAVARSNDGAERWEGMGKIDGAPAALATEAEALYVALHDGTVLLSKDAGKTWTVRLPRPKATIHTVE